ncbi:M20 family metallopeptidase [Rubinisphaera italica]|uniref:Probable succinyl-diaminopimelate desuccinylase n=1 Tax=Rubinisphaera italica TaxID=2527969 RepID=A0A5C5XKY5_9PLAN|nr:M20 family metallopeptidase [Rubinisphaera italica]TWT63886.1 Acetylornithine deacetylase [Rubinisphaera italica]
MKVERDNRDASMTSSTVHDPLGLLQELIAIPSVNPMGNDLSGPQFFEQELTKWLVGFFRELGTPYEIQPVADGRSNVIARLEIDSALPSIMLEAHQDTVPVDGMTIEPFAPLMENGRIYGRGACDVKGGMAAMLSTFARLVREGTTAGANVIMSCTCDEEYTAKGARHLAQQWSCDQESQTPVSSRPDFCIVAEPTDLNVIVAHRGVVRWKIQTHGRACHSSRPQDGHSAIYDMAHIVSALEKYAEALQENSEPHPLCGSSSLSIGKITGGTSVNIVPHLCEIEIDRRSLPGECSAKLLEDIEQFLRSETTVNFTFTPPWIDSPSLADDFNQNLAESLLNTINGIVDTPRVKQGAWYGTDASTFAAGGVPSVVFGPGSIAQAHTADEWIEIEQLRQACEIYYQFCKNPTGLSITL